MQRALCHAPQSVSCRAPRRSRRSRRPPPPRAAWTRPSQRLLRNAGASATGSVVGQCGVGRLSGVLLRKKARTSRAAPGCSAGRRNARAGRARAARQWVRSARRRKRHAAFAPRRYNALARSPPRRRCRCAAVTASHRAVEPRERVHPAPRVMQLLGPRAAWGAGAAGRTSRAAAGEQGNAGGAARARVACTGASYERTTYEVGIHRSPGPFSSWPLLCCAKRRRSGYRMDTCMQRSATRVA